MSQITLHQAIDTALAHQKAGRFTEAGALLRAVLSNPELKSAILDYRAHLEAKLTEQDNTRTFFDFVLADYLMTALTPSGDVSMDALTMIDFVLRRMAGRFVDYFDRRETSGCMIPAMVMNLSQGTDHCLRWKGLPLFKSAFDIAIYQQMVQEVRPGTLIEIGSGSGASALWFADLMRSLGVMGHVESMDINQPAAQDALVIFRQGDCGRIAEAFDTMEDWPHPWLVIEDAHVHVDKVLAFFDDHLKSGDYLVIEDSFHKEKEISGFLSERRDRYRVDTRYTDLLGKNATTAVDSILRRV